MSGLYKNEPVQAVRVMSRHHYRQFLEFPYRHYKNVALWVPPLRQSQRTILSTDHPFWKKNPHVFLLAMQGGQCVGRIAAFLNQSFDTRFGGKCGFFGFLEFDQDQKVLQCLTDAASDFLKSQGCQFMMGPFNPDIHNELGFLTSGFDAPPCFMLTYNFAWYPAMMEAAGFAKAKDFFAYPLEVRQYGATVQMERIGRMLHQRYDINLRTPNMRRFRAELVHFHDIYNDAFANHWGFAPIPEDEFMALAEDMKFIIDPRMVLILEIGGEPAAFLLSLPDINEILITLRSGRLLPWGLWLLLTRRRHLHSLRVITVAVKRKFQHLGLGALLYPELMERGRKFGYHRGELSWIAEDNVPMNGVARELSGDPGKTYRVYQRTL